MSARRLRLAVTERAAIDVVGIQRYSIDRWSTEQATAYEQAIDRALDILCAQPRLGIRRDDLLPGLRSHHVLRHTIYYLIEGDMIVVQRILHERMDPSPEQLT